MLCDFKDISYKVLIAINKSDSKELFLLHF
jgi:hypothetical protein